MHVDPAAGGGEAQIPLKAVQLRTGATVVARVAEAPAQDARGQLALAGVVVRAKLPAGVRKGQRLTLRVAGQIGDQLVLRLVPEPQAKRPRGSARLASSLATRRDGDLLRVAVNLAGGGPVPLPGRRFAAVAREGGDESGADGGADAAVRLTLHTPELGSVELVVSLVGDRLQAVAVVDGPLVDGARLEAPALAERLGVATGLPASVSVQRRGGPPPAEPSPVTEVDERYA
jgi:hypothetical protein